MKHRIIVLVVFSILITSAVKAQEFSMEIAKSIIEVAKETSYYKHRVDWNEIEERFYQLCQNKTTHSEIKPALEYLLNSLGDKHGTFRNAENFSMVAYYTGKYDESDNRDSDFVNNVINDPSSKFDFKKLEDVGYLKIMGIHPQLSVNEEAASIRNAIKELHREGIKKWIVDLRYNGGGNMNPMIAGLAPLIGEGKIGGNIGPDGDVVRSYEIKDGQFYDTDLLVDETGNEPRIDVNHKVVVLLSRYTISSGELVAVAFKGRQNCIFIGEPSAAYTTANGVDYVSDDLMMIISKAIYSDRNGHHYDGRVGVDIEIPFHHDKEIDQQLIKAIEWLGQ